MDSMWMREFEMGESNNDDTPRAIIQKQCTALADKTENRIIARVSAYDGVPHSFTRSGMANAGLDLIESLTGTSFDIQSELGEVAEDSMMAYEFYVTCKKMPKYKFRAFFIYHGVLIYPVNFSIEYGIAKEINVDTEIQVNDEEEFRDLLKKILNSDRMTMVINNLLKVSR